MLYKNKGSVNDPSKCRCIGLLPHAYKLLSVAMLERISNECADFPSDWQAGFRPERGCRDNVLLLRVLLFYLSKQSKMARVYTSHLLTTLPRLTAYRTNSSLKRAGTSRKTRVMFRAIYAAAKGTARVRDLNGNQVYSSTFKVRRGVIQGDIISPIFHSHYGTNVQVARSLARRCEGWELPACGRPGLCRRRGHCVWSRGLTHWTNCEHRGRVRTRCRHVDKCQ